MKNEDKLIMSKKVNLASPKAGAKIIDVSDDFFAKCDRMLNDTEIRSSSDLFSSTRCLKYDGKISIVPSVGIK